MSFPLHAHHAFLIATLAFSVAVLTLDWYTSPGKRIKYNVFQLCTANACSSYSCNWLFLFNWTNLSFRNILPLLTASSAVACGGVSLLGLLLGSWYIQRAVGESRSKWLLTLTCLAAFFSFLFSCGVWSIILTTNLHQGTGYSIRLADFGFSFWMNIGSSVLYFYALMIYLFAGCASQ